MLRRNGAGQETMESAGEVRQLVLPVLQSTRSYIKEKLTGYSV